MNAQDHQAIARFVARQGSKLKTILSPTMTREVQIVMVAGLADYIAANVGCCGSYQTADYRKHCLTCGSQTFDRDQFIRQCYGEVTP